MDWILEIMTFEEQLVDMLKNSSMKTITLIIAAGLTNNTMFGDDDETDWILDSIDFERLKLKRTMMNFFKPNEGFSIDGL